MQRKQCTLALWASGLLFLSTMSAALSNDLHFGDVPIGETKVLRLYGGLGLAAGSAGGGSCSRGMVTRHLLISGANASEFRDIGGTYMGLHVPGNRYFEDIRFAPSSIGEKTATFAPETNPVSPTCGLQTRPSTLSGKALPAKHKSIFARLLPKRKHKHTAAMAPAAYNSSLTRQGLPPLVHLLARLSRNVYSGNSSMYGYHFIGDTCSLTQYNCDAVGFIASAYQSNDGSETIIALRGSPATQSSLRDGLYGTTTESAIEILGPKVRKILVSDVQAAAAFVKLVESRYMRSHIILTGHSLGGSIAQLLSTASGNQAYVFDAPGTKVLFKRLAIPLGNFETAQSRNVQNINIRMNGDQVSESGEQMGNTITLKSPAALNIPENKMARAQVCTTLLPVLSQLHSMDTIIEQMANDAPTVAQSATLNFTPALTANLWCENPSSLF